MPTPSSEEVKAARLKHNLSQTEAANLVNVGRPAWHKWENSKNSMHPAFWELFQIKVGMIKVKKLKQ